MEKIELQPLSERSKKIIIRSALSSSVQSRATIQASERIPRDMNAMLNHAFKIAQETIK